MRPINVSQLSDVCGGVIQGYGPSGPNLVEVGSTRMGDDVHYAGAFNGYTAEQCAALGTLAGLGSGLTAGGLCSVGALAATGGIAVPICTAAGGLTASVVGSTVTSTCNTRSGK